MVAENNGYISNPVKPTAEKIMSILVELYAKQNGVRIGYTVESASEPEKHS